MIQHFFNDDEGYKAWCDVNESGYVFNYFGGIDAQAEMNKIHRSVCHTLWRAKDEGVRTSTYEKVCSEDLDELICFVERERGSSWSYCKICFKFE